MEQNAAYNAINFMVPMLDLGPFTGASFPQNSTAGLIQIASLLCPSESLVHPVSYYRDLGPVQLRWQLRRPGDDQFVQRDHRPPRGDLFVSSPNMGPISIASVTDGTSNTALFSEHLLGYAGTLLDNAATSQAVIGSPYAKRAIFVVSSVSPYPDMGATGVQMALSLIAGCRSLPAGTEPSADAGAAQLAVHPGLRHGGRLV